MQVAQRDKSQRRRIQKTVFTPTRRMDAPQTKTVTYRLDEEKALKKKLQSASRLQDDIYVTDKRNTLIISNLTTGAYELLKNRFFEYYGNTEDYTATLANKISKGKTTDANPVVEESLSIKSKAGGRQLFRINFFNTTNKIGINGYRYRLCIEKDLGKITSILKDGDLIDKLNERIKEACASALNQIDDAGADDQFSLQNASRPDIQPSEDRQKILQLPQGPVVLNTDRLAEEDRAAEVDESDLICICCQEDTAGTPSIVCSDCNRWFHEQCIDGPTENPTDFICQTCKLMDHSHGILDASNTSIAEITQHNQLAITDLPDENPGHTIPMTSQVPQARHQDGRDPLGSISMNNSPVKQPTDAVTDVDATEKNPDTAPQPELTLSSTLKSTYPDPATQSQFKVNPQKSAVADPVLHQTPSSTSRGTDLPPSKPMQPQGRLPKKKTTKTASEEQLAECRARIQMLESENKDYSNTIRLMQQRVKIDTETVIGHIPETPQDETNLRLPSIQQVIDTQNSILQKLQANEVNMQHYFENQTLRMQIQSLEIQKEFMHTFYSSATGRMQPQQMCSTNYPTQYIAPQQVPANPPPLHHLNLPMPQPFMPGQPIIVNPQPDPAYNLGRQTHVPLVHHGQLQQNPMVNPGLRQQQQLMAHHGPPPAPTYMGQIHPQQFAMVNPGHQQVVTQPLLPLMRHPQMIPIPISGQQPLQNSYGLGNMQPQQNPTGHIPHLLPPQMEQPYRAAPTQVIQQQAAHTRMNDTQPQTKHKPHRGDDSLEPAFATANGHTLEPTQTNEKLGKEAETHDAVHIDITSPSREEQYKQRSTENNADDDSSPWVRPEEDTNYEVTTHEEQSTDGRNDIQISQATVKDKNFHTRTTCEDDIIILSQDNTTPFLGKGRASERRDNPRDPAEVLA